MRDSDSARGDRPTGDATGVRTDPVHCLGCGEPVGDTVDACPACGADHMTEQRLDDVGETAAKDRDWGVGFVRLIPPLLPIIAWRQARIERAQRALIDYRSQFDAAETVHCRSCGAALARDDPSCEACGRENTAAVIDAMDFDVHDPGEHDTERSNRWWVGPVCGPYAGLVAFLAAAPLGVSNLEGPLLFGGGVVAFVAGHFDREYVRANAPWSPTYTLLAGMLVPFLNLGLAWYYVDMRVRMLGYDGLL